MCPLVACLLPARPVVADNAELLRGLDETEDALEACAVQVLECIQIQEVGRHAAQVEEAVPGRLVRPVDR